MKLLYLYIKDFGCLKDIEINFDSNWRFHLDKRNPDEYVLECHKQNVIPEHFWSSDDVEKDVVECVSAIVGVNGSGKTTIIRAIQEIFAQSNHTIEHIIVFQHEEKNKEKSEHVLTCQIHLLKHITSDMLWRHRKKRQNAEDCVYFNKTQMKILHDYLPKPYGKGKKIEEISLDDVAYKYAYDFFTLSSPGENNEFPLLEEIRQNVSIHSQTRGIECHYWKPYSSENIKSWNFLPIYYSPFFTTESGIDSSRIQDISTTHCLDTYVRNGSEHHQSRIDNLSLSPINVFQATEYQLVLRFLSDVSNKHPELLKKLHMPNFQGMLISPANNLLKYAIEDLSALRQKASLSGNNKKHFEKLTDVASKQYNRLDRAIKIIVKRHTNDFFITTFICYFSCLCRDTIRDTGVLVTHRENIEPDTVDKLIDVLEYVIQKIPMASASSNSIPVYQKLHRYILSKLKTIDQKAYDCFSLLYSLYKDNLKRSFRLVIPEELNCRIRGKKWLDWMLDFFAKYFKCKSNTNFITFSFLPKISSGEMAFISFFSRFFMNFTYEKEKCNDELLLFVDEFETALHPQWQLDLVLLTIAFLEAYLPKSRVHIIFASHSPMLLSDIPAGNVCFLDKENGKTLQRESIMNTYGANVFDLYRNSYFLHEGTIGKFASERLQRLLDIVRRKKNRNDIDVNWDDVYNEISLIGDPLIRNYLVDKLVHNREVSRSILEEQKDILKEKLAQIEKELKDTIQ